MGKLRGVLKLLNGFPEDGNAHAAWAGGAGWELPWLELGRGRCGAVFGAGGQTPQLPPAPPVHAWGKLLASPRCENH